MPIFCHAVKRSSNIQNFRITVSKQRISTYQYGSWSYCTFFHIFPSTLKRHPKMNKTSQSQNPGKKKNVSHFSINPPKQKARTSTEGSAVFQVWCNWSHLLGHANTGWGKYSFLLGIFGDIEKSCGSEYQRELLRNIYMFLMCYIGTQYAYVYVVLFTLCVSSTSEGVMRIWLTVAYDVRVLCWWLLCWCRISL